MYPMQVQTMAFLLAGTFASTALFAQQPCHFQPITQQWLQQQDLSWQEWQQEAARWNQPATPRAGNATIPVVVHVVWHTQAGNVPTGTIQNVINQMNADFQALNGDYDQVRPVFAGSRGDPQIEFCLATTDPSGNPTTGITRRQTSKTWFNPDTETNTMKQSTHGTPAWDPTSYLNIWICDISSGAAGGLVTAGYAYPPMAGVVGEWFDGLVLDAQYGLVRTGSHEAGHYLGLDHPWGDGNCAVNDAIADTPATDSPTYSCTNPNLMKCGTLTQYENFMDYSNCRMMFTNGQATVMNNVLNGVRAGLLASGACTGGGPGPGMCIPTSSNGPSDGDFIDGVVLGTINNTNSGSISGPAYVDNTSLSTNLTRGVAYQLEITGGGYTSDHYAAWIDYNGDGVFSPDEKLGGFTTASPYEAGTILFTVPALAATGSTVMRVRGVYILSNEPSPTDPCYHYAFGETEDYTVHIVDDGGGGQPACIPTSAYGTSDGDFIDAVIMGAIYNVNSGGQGGPSYVDNTSSSTDLARSGTYHIVIAGGDYAGDHYAAWIDYDGDGSFSADEKLGEFITENANEAWQITFEVPADALLGSTTLRVRGVYHLGSEPSPTDPCYDYAYGETEDYGIVIVEAGGTGNGACVPSALIGPVDGDHIDGVVLGAINNTGTGAETAFTYVDYTEHSTILMRGETYELSITGGGYAADVYAAWIDFNGDLTFSSSEKLGEFTTSSPAETQTLSFTVPTTAALGSTTLRVRGVYPLEGEPQTIDPCFEYTYGETEDYGIDIALSTALAGQAPMDLAVQYHQGMIRITWPVTAVQRQAILLDGAGRTVMRLQPQGDWLDIPTTLLEGGIYQLVLDLDGTRHVVRFAAGLIR